MAITAQNVYRHELIGLHVKVIDARNSANIGVQGKIIDETLKSLVIRDKGAAKRIFKTGAVFEVTLPEGKTRLDGDKIAARPWERTGK